MAVHLYISQHSRGELESTHGAGAGLHLLRAVDDAQQLMRWGCAGRRGTFTIDDSLVGSGLEGHLPAVKAHMVLGQGFTCCAQWMRHSR